MCRERQDDTIRQPLSDRVALRTSEFNGRAYEVGSAYGIDNEFVGSAAREEQQGWLEHFEIVRSALGQRERACLEQVQMTDARKVYRLAQLPSEKGPGGRGGVGEQSGKGVHRDYLQRFWHQTPLIILHSGRVQDARSNKDFTNAPYRPN